jgi:hypothetical protein
VLSLGYLSLHEQRKVTRSEGAKALAVEVEIAVAFDDKQRKSRRAAEQAPLYEVTATCTNIHGSPLYQPSAVEKRFAGMTIDTSSGRH